MCVCVYTIYMYECIRHMLVNNLDEQYAASQQYDTDETVFVDVSSIVDSTSNEEPSHQGTEPVVLDVQSSQRE